MTRWLVTGAAGMLGQDVCQALIQAGQSRVSAATRAELDLCEPIAVTQAVAGHDIVINTAAWTDVDGAQTNEPAATAINGTAVAHLARACARVGAPLIQISTDYVFAGNATEPYAEDSPTAPLNAYGRGKLIGEQAVRRELPEHGYVVRTAWLYAGHGRNFVTTMLRLAQTRQTIEVVTDQCGQPTWSFALAEQVVALGRAALAGRAPAGIYHGTAGGRATWFDLAQAVFVEVGLDPNRIRPTTSDRFPRPAARPSFSVLAHERWSAAGIAPLPDWRGMLSTALSRLAPVSALASEERIPPEVSQS